MHRIRLAGLLCLAVASLLTAGCSRVYWRQNADAEAYGLIREKTQLDARWAPPRSDVIPNPLSRLYDPADPDYGPLPADDPYANRYMDAMSDCDRIRGSAYWDEIGMSDTIENPAWVASLQPETLPGPMLADKLGESLNSDSPVGADDKTDLAEQKPLPFFQRFAVTETLRSWRESFGVKSSPPAGRATIATADANASRASLARIAKRTDAPTAMSPATKTAAATPKPATQSVARSEPAAVKTQSPPQSKSSSKPLDVAHAGKEPMPQASAKPAATANPFDVKDGETVQLASFQDEAPLPAPEPPTVEDDAAPRTLDEVPPAADTTPDVDGSLTPPSDDPQTATRAPEGPDLAAPNPALPRIDQLTLAEAIRLSYLHSREYQTQIENVYLAALDLAFDRFQFDVRFLGLSGRPTSDLAYTGTPDGTQGLTWSNTIGMRRLLPAGGQWAVELANQTLWLFSDSPNESGTASSLTFSFIQPLLFAAGRKVVLEDLTQSERNLLYAARELARFRQQFFVSVVSNYLDLMQQIQGIANQEDNLRRLREQVTIARENTLTGSPLARVQLESQELQQVTQLRSSRASLQNQLDQFKIQIGLPPDVGTTLDTSFLRPFQLISSDLLVLEEVVDDRYFAIAQTVSPDAPNAAGISEALKTLLPILDEVDSIAIPQVAEDMQAVEENLPTRLAGIDDPLDRARILTYWERDQGLFTSLQEQAVEQRRSIEQLLTRLATADEQLKQAITAADTPEELRAAYAPLRDLYIEAGVTEEKVERIVRGLQGLQVGLRTDLIVLNPFEMDEAEAVGYALTNRVDLMNERALVTDARRKTEVSANALRAVLDLRVEEEVRTRPLLQNDNPFDFRGDQSTFRAGVRFVAPLDQIAARNSYRAAQITYQRQRRSYMLAEDQVKLQIRQAWRNLVVLRQNFEVARNAIRINAQQYDLAIEQASAPSRGGSSGGGGGGGGGGGSGGGGSSGADQQGLNLINALNRLLQSQNQLIGILVDYETARLNIYRDMGIMEVDARGLWVEPYYQNGLMLPEGDGIQGPPGWINPASLLDDESDGTGAPSAIPPAPAPADGVENTGGGAPRAVAEKSPTESASPAGKAVQTAAYSKPPSPSPRKAGHERNQQPPVLGRSRSGNGNASVPTEGTGKSRWRAAAKPET